MSSSNDTRGNSFKPTKQRGERLLEQLETLAAELRGLHEIYNARGEAGFQEVKEAAETIAQSIVLLKEGGEAPLVGEAVKKIRLYADAVSCEITEERVDTWKQKPRESVGETAEAIRMQALEVEDCLV